MNALETLIRSEIESHGALSLERFMELALYHPELGYYSKLQAVSQVGKRGDFMTSVSVGPLFGRLLAYAWAETWQSLGKPASFSLVEMGAHTGDLAKDILFALRNEFPECAENTRYLIVEPLRQLAAKQREQLQEFKNVQWNESLERLPPFEGILFANELLDAFPIRQVEYFPEEQQWKEWCVDLQGGQLTWTSRPCSEPWLQDLPRAAKGRIEVNRRALEWIGKVHQCLKKGKVVLFDYGITDDEYFQSPRPQGTLRGYREHKYVDDVLAHAGEQDLTAHVRWTPVIQKAEQMGLRTMEFIQQSRWLTRIVAKYQLQLNPKELREFQTLAHPTMLGSPFRVLELAKLS
jgi:SAM-dependent MidA family methyltransferase